MAMIHVMHCREIATLLDSDAVQDLRWVDRIQLRVHLWVCSHCRVLVRQIAWLGAAAREHISHRFDPDAGFEERILKRLQ